MTEQRQTTIPIAAVGQISNVTPDRSSSPVIQREPAIATRKPSSRTHAKTIFMRDIAGGSRNAEYAEPQQTIAANETNRIRSVIHASSGKRAGTKAKQGPMQVKFHCTALYLSGRMFTDYC
jgi:hypothetical protein